MFLKFCMRLAAGAVMHAAQSQQTQVHSCKGHGSIEVAPVSDDHQAQQEDAFIRSLIDENSKSVQLFQVSVLQFSPGGCDILVVGTHGEILCLDSLSAATLWSIPAHLDQLKRCHVITSSHNSQIPELVLVDEHGLVRPRCYNT